MKNVEIPKEIQQENKVVLMFTLRQLICLVIAAGLSFAISVVFRLDFSLAVYPSMVIGVTAFAFGWVKVDGLPFEKLLLKRLQGVVYQNQVRAYQTKNRYVSLLNQEYDRRRATDLGNRKVKRAIKKESKKRAREGRKQQAKGFF